MAYMQLYIFISTRNIHMYDTYVYIYIYLVMSCVHIYTYVYTYIYIYIHIYTHIYLYIPNLLYIRIYTYIYIYIYVFSEYIYSCRRSGGEKEYSTNSCKMLSHTVTFVNFVVYARVVARGVYVR